MSARGKGQSGRTQPCGTATISGKRRDMKYTGGQVAPRKPRCRVRGGGCSAAPPSKWKMEMPLRGALTTRTPPRCSFTSPAPAAPRPRNRRPTIFIIIDTDTEREKFGRGMTVFWRRIVDEPDAFRQSSGNYSYSRASRRWGKRAGRFAWAWY